MSAAIDAIFIGGCADGEVKRLVYALPMAKMLKTEPLSIKPVIEPAVVKQRYDDETYYHHPLNMADGRRFDLYIVQEMQPSEAMDQILTRYVNGTAGVRS